MPTPVGVGIPQAALNCTRPIFIFFNFSCSGGLSCWAKVFRFRRGFPWQLPGQSELESELRLVIQETTRFRTNFHCLNLSLSSLVESEVVRGWLGTTTAARHLKGRRVSVDKAGQVSQWAGSGSPCELSDVMRSTVPDTRECAARVTCKDGHECHTHDHSTWPRVHDGTFQNALRCIIDVTRTTHTNQEVLQESRIDDVNRKLSDSWTRFTKFTMKILQKDTCGPGGGSQQKSSKNQTRPFVARNMVRHVRSKSQRK